jgi:hypothetical protein
LKMNSASLMATLMPPAALLKRVTLSRTGIGFYSIQQSRLNTSRVLMNPQNLQRANACRVSRMQTHSDYCSVKILAITSVTEQNFASNRMCRAVGGISISYRQSLMAERGTETGVRSGGRVHQHQSARKGIKEQDELLVGPIIGLKPTRQLRIGLEPLLGCTRASPRVATFLLIPYELGGAEAVVSPMPHD